MAFKFARRAGSAAIGLLTVAALGLTGCTSAPGGGSVEVAATLAEDTNAQLEDAVRQAMAQSGSSQALVGVWAPWAGEYVQSFGSDENAPELGSTFRAGQTAQPFTCALLLELVNQGKVSLDRKVSKDLPRQIGIGDVTYGQLCQGTSGLGDFKAGLTGIFTNNPDRVWSDRELISNGLVRSPLSYPGLDFHFSDTDALLLGRALEVRMNRDLPDLLEDEVFAPNGMNGSALPEPGPAELAAPALAATVYPAGGDGPVCDALTPVTTLSPSMLSGAGGATTTLHDLKHFIGEYVEAGFEGEPTAGVMAQNRPLENPKRDENGEPLPAEEGAPAASGQTWGFGVLNVGPLTGRAGAITGTISAAFHDPKSDFTVVVALNNSSAGGNFAQDLALRLSAIVAETQPGGLEELPWTSEAKAEALAGQAVCQ